MRYALICTSLAACLTLLASPASAQGTWLDALTALFKPTPPAETKSQPPVSKPSPQAKPEDPAAPTPPAAKGPTRPIIPAKILFGAAKSGAPLEARAIGSYAKGCLAGGRALPIDGTAWQAMRLKRNRNWGHPSLVAWLEKFAKETQAGDGWSGLLVGDISQPRGGPMLTGHASHQIGLDADIWLTPMPNRRLTVQEREDMSAVSMLTQTSLDVDPKIWTEQHARIIKRAASSPEIERIFVHPAIKKALCADAAKLGGARSWLTKVRPMWGHNYHFHVRMACPKDSATCKPQDPVGITDDGCGKELADWYALLTAPPKPPPQPGPPKPPPPPLTLDGLPGECKVVLEAGVSQGVKPAAAPKSSPPAKVVAQ